METVTASAAKTRFGELLARVASGEEIVITRHDKPVARVIPEGRPNTDAVRGAVAGLRQLQRGLAAHSQGQSKITWNVFKALVENGRK